MAQGISTPDPSLSRTHFSTRRGRATTTHYIHHQVSLMVLRNTTLVPSMGFCIGLASEAGLSAGIRRDRGPPQRRKKEIKKEKKEERKQQHIWHLLNATFDPYLDIPKDIATKRKEGTSRTQLYMYHHAKFHAVRPHRRRDICPQTKKQLPRI